VIGHESLGTTIDVGKGERGGREAPRHGKRAAAVTSGLHRRPSQEAGGRYRRPSQEAGGGRDGGRVEHTRALQVARALGIVLEHFAR
jgi:hypothetical protein